MKKKPTLTCEFCGEPIHGEGYTIKVEGALLKVCSKCKSYGNIVESPSTPKKQFNQSSYPGSRRVQSVSNPPNRYRGSAKPVSTVSLKENYDELIRGQRTKLKMTRKDLAAKTGISVSQLSSFETGKLQPTDSESKKLERTLNISLFEEMSVVPEHQQTKEKKKTTFGDIVTIKRRSEE